MYATERVEVNALEQGDVVLNGDTGSYGVIMSTELDTEYDVRTITIGMDHVELTFRGPNKGWFERLVPESKVRWITDQLPNVPEQDAAEIMAMLPE